MSVNLTWGGNIIPYPENNNQNWGLSATSTIVAINKYCLQSTGGTYSLSAPLNFGTSFGLKSLYYEGLGTTPAASGVIRLGFSETIAFRNNANSADLVLNVNAAGQLLFNGTVVSAGTGGFGNVVGPLSSTNGAIPSFGGTTGTVLLNTPATLDSSGNIAHVNNLSMNGTATLSIGTVAALSAAGLSASNVAIGTNLSVGNTAVIANGTIAQLTATVIINNPTTSTNAIATEYMNNGTYVGQINTCTNPGIVGLQIIGGLNGLFLCGSNGQEGILINNGGTVTMGANGAGYGVVINGNFSAQFGSTQNFAVGTGLAVGNNMTCPSGTFSGNLLAPTVGTNDNSTNVATTAFVKNVLGANGDVKAWASYNGVANAIASSGNISSITRNSTGNYTAHYITAMAGAPSVTISVNNAGGGSVTNILSSTATSVNFQTFNLTGASVNCAYIGITVVD